MAPESAGTVPYKGLFSSLRFIVFCDQENMIARSNRAFQTGIGPDPYPSPAPPRAAEGVSGWRS